MMRIAIAALLLSVSLPSLAGESGLVSRLYPDANSNINFQLQNSCKTGTVYWQFDIRSDLGKAWYAMLLSAANNKKPVSIAFPGTCDPNQHQTIWFVYQDF